MFVSFLKVSSIFICLCLCCRQSSVKPSPDAADSNKEVIELHQAEIETLEKSSAEQWQLLAELKNRLRASRAVNLSLRQQRLQQSQQLQQQLLKVNSLLAQIWGARKKAKGWKKQKGIISHWPFLPPPPSKKYMNENRQAV
jgi:septal ring factor EnvC (AmiA/AmiB activator)